MQGFHLSIFKDAVLHIIGIGGIGMSGIAEMLHKHGFYIQGSDIKESANCKRLCEAGIKIFIGHSKQNIKNADYIIKSSDIQNDNIEIVEATKLGIPIISRAAIVNEMLRSCNAICITGAHGKTSTTGILGHLFVSAKLDPNILVGGLMNDIGKNYRAGFSEHFIVEADESDATFVQIPAISGVITNIDAEHLNYYHTFDNLLTHYKLFVNNIPFYGLLMVCFDNKYTQQIINPQHQYKTLSYGIANTDVDLKAYNLRFEDGMQKFDLILSERAQQKLHNAPKNINNIELSIVGEHNVLNSLATIGIALFYNINIETILAGLKTYPGIKRRFTRVQNIEGIEVIDDYAHHPAEIISTLAMARKYAGGNNKVIAVVQPHRYSRLQSLFNEFSTCFKGANKIYVLDVYSAGESVLPNIDAQHLTHNIVAHDCDAEYIKDPETLVYKIKSLASNGDYVLFLGAGDITKMAYDFANKFKK